MQEPAENIGVGNMYLSCVTVRPDQTTELCLVVAHTRNFVVHSLPGLDAPDFRDNVSIYLSVLSCYMADVLLDCERDEFTDDEEIIELANCMMRVWEAICEGCVRYTRLVLFCLLV